MFRGTPPHYGHSGLTACGGVLRIHWDMKLGFSAGLKRSSTKERNSLDTTLDTTLSSIEYKTRPERSSNLSPTKKGGELTSEPSSVGVAESESRLNFVKAPLRPAKPLFPVWSARTLGTLASRGALQPPGYLRWMYRRVPQSMMQGPLIEVRRFGHKIEPGQQRPSAVRACGTSLVPFERPPEPFL